MLSMLFCELDVVRVTRLLTATRHVDGSSGMVRQPRVGDVGAIVHVLGEKAFVVECVDAGGLTAWVADFEAEEIELVSQRSECE
jgi:hypothetical protein